MQTRHFYAMGSHMTVWLESDADVLEGVVEQFAAAETRFSRFRPDSELSQLNTHQDEWVTVTADLFHILTHALKLAAATNGRFDPTILPALKTAGYYRSFEQLEQISLPQTSNYFIDYRAIELDESQCAVRLPPGIFLDLGGIAKGYTAQKTIEWLRNWGPCLLDAGGDLVAGDAPLTHPGWPVGIATPWMGEDEQGNLLRLWLVNASLATSGIDYRHWQRDGKQKHHIIDPTTGDSAVTDLLTVSILHEDASTAEAWATAALVGGQSHTLDLFTHCQFKAALIDKIHSITLTPALHPLVQWEC